MPGVPRPPFRPAERSRQGSGSTSLRSTSASPSEDGIERVRIDRAQVRVGMRQYVVLRAGCEGGREMRGRIRHHPVYGGDSRKPEVIATKAEGRRVGFQETTCPDTPRVVSRPSRNHADRANAIQAVGSEREKRVIRGERGCEIVR